MQYDSKSSVFLFANLSFKLCGIYLASYLDYHSHTSHLNSYTYAKSVPAGFKLRTDNKESDVKNLTLPLVSLLM